MNRLPLLAALLLPALLTLTAPAQAQNPRIDPSFLLTNMYRPASGTGALQLRDGSRVVVGNFTRAEGQATLSGLVRYLPSGVPDVVFNTAIETMGIAITSMAEAADGRLLLGGLGGITQSGRVLPPLVRLNADGTRDATFQVPTPNPQSGHVTALLVQPDGKLLVGGNLSFMGLSTGLARLNLNGTLDTSFQPQLTAGVLTGVRSLVQQADSKLVVAAYVQPAGSQNGTFELLRLLANGTQDTSFQPALAPGVVLAAVALQPDGQLLLGSVSGPVLAGGTASLARLSPTGQADATFAPPTQLVPNTLAVMPTMAVQADGRIVLTNNGAMVTGQQPVARLLPSGAYDPSWSVPQAPADIFPFASTVQLLPGGQVLTAGQLLRLGDAHGLARGAAVLNSTGQPQSSFAPLLQESGAVHDVTQQPDGRLVAVGDFSEVNGTAVRQIARFQPDGQLDTTFCRLARLTGGLPLQVLAQPNGTVLVGGRFEAVGGSARVALARLLPDGQLDAAFVPPLLGAVGTAGSSSVTLLARQPNGAVLAAGSMRQAGIANRTFLRFDPSGQPDANFQPSPTLIPNSLLVQPDGNIVVGTTGPQPLRRLWPDGSPDPTFTPPVFTVPSGVLRVSALDRYADGRLLLAGRFAQVGGAATTNVARLLPDGSVDASFASQVFQLDGRVTSVAIQPNERVLLAGSPQFIPTATTNSLYRLLPDGSADASFDATQGPVFGSRNQGTARVLVQADGAIVAAGAFETVAGLPIGGLVRLLDPNVLAVRAGQTAGQLQAWPVPAHETLQVSWRAGIPARRAQLLDNLGRVVQTVEQPAPGLRLATAGLAPGLYLLRVDYVAANPGFRRIVVE
ncbi:delta-60 repeat domain-containing protein [Hymenobacter sp. ASUV-10]|uniref:Delta-60 repeat domain-containing protein n=1 Tax=Hymenobacter aranciens TaxID=3063996 RepID=A0ABT9B6E3_9BACT|nr:delta-60 repeat domain-containing protein [Hymenobacter sp. ASUV-10]MDO7873722.1 delta-60 repeat domain-containing protein [Hymenobacter sp. ASUV-10]